VVPQLFPARLLLHIRKAPEDNGSKASQIVSVAFDLVIRDPTGREMSLEDLLKKQSRAASLRLELNYALTKKHKKEGKSVRIGYLCNGGSSWKFLSEERSDSESELREIGVVKGNTNHLTSR